jgi:hypothetical protein
MRGQDTQQSAMFSYLAPEERVPEDHPLRPIRQMVDVTLKALSPSFDEMYSAYGRPSIRLLEGDVAEKFFAQVLDQARNADLLSDEHFSVDGTLIEAWASQKSFQRRDGGDQKPKDDPGNPTVNFHGETRSNETHQSTTDPDARLARKSSGHEAKLAYCGNVLMENRHGLVVDTELLQCNGTAERDAALLMVEELAGCRPVTVAGDKGYDTKDFVKEMRGMNATPHVAQNQKRPGGSAIRDSC